MDCNPPGSSVHGILQIRILDWVDISFSRDRTGVSCHGRQVLYCLSHQGTLKVILYSDFLSCYLVSFFCFRILSRGGGRRRQWHPTPVLLPGKSHGQRSLVGCSPWGRYELDATERLHFHVSLSCIREGNGNPLQCSCLENPRDGGAWWAAAYGVAQNRTRLKRLSRSRGGAFGREWVHVHVWLSPFAVHLKPSQRCQLAIPQYKMFLVFLVLFKKRILSRTPYYI